MAHNVLDAEQRDTLRRIGGTMKKAAKHSGHNNSGIPKEAPLHVFNPPKIDKSLPAIDKGDNKKPASSPRRPQDSKAPAISTSKK